MNVLRDGGLCNATGRGHIVPAYAQRLAPLPGPVRDKGGRSMTVCCGDSQMIPGTGSERSD